MDAGKIGTVEGALREALLSARPSPAQPGTGTAADHEPAHPGRNGVIVNLSSGNRDAGDDTRRSAAATRNGPSPEIGMRDIASAHDTDLLARAMRAAHTGVTATVSQALARAEEHAPSSFGLAWQSSEDAASNASVSPPRAQTGGGNAGPIAPPVVLLDAGIRADAHAATLIMMTAPGAAVGSAHAEHAKHAPAPRPAPELVSPFLVRQEPADAPSPYLNHIILGAAFLGLVILLVL